MRVPTLVRSRGERVEREHPRRPLAHDPDRPRRVNLRRGTAWSSRGSSACLGSRPADEIDARRYRRPRRGPRREGKPRDDPQDAAALAMVLDHAGVDPNPARDPGAAAARGGRGDQPAERRARRGGLPAPAREAPARAPVPRLVGRPGRRDRPALVADYDEPRRRVRLRAGRRRRGRRSGSSSPPCSPSARGDARGRARTATPRRACSPTRGADALRTSIAKACRAAGVPLFSPHDLRHRRISLLHRAGKPWARIGELVGQRTLRHRRHLHARPHDEAELDYAALLR